MLGFAPSVADAVLDALCRGATFTGPSALYFQLHTGQPGADGTENVARLPRKPVGFRASVLGTNVSTNDMKWPNVANEETYTHFSVWDPAGTFMFSGTMARAKVTSGDNLVIEAGSELSTLNVAT